MPQINRNRISVEDRLERGRVVDYGTTAGVIFARGPLSTAVGRGVVRYGGKARIIPIEENRTKSFPTVEYRLEKEPRDNLAIELKAITEAIKKSESILNLEENWDGEGAESYTREVWSSATNFLWQLAEWAYIHLKLIIPVPRILPSDEGSIDLHWKTDKYELLVSIPSNTDEAIDYYGDNYKEVSPIRSCQEAEEPYKVIASWIYYMNNVAC